MKFAKSIVSSGLTFTQLGVRTELSALFMVRSGDALSCRT
jgi:hypothetical protein